MQAFPRSESQMTHSSEVQVAEHATAQSCDVSVVIPCYRCVTTLQRAVASVAAQTVSPREVILVDDDSDDGGATCTAIERIQAAYSSVFKVRSRRQVPNQGPSIPRNLGWNLARSQFVAFLDADGAWHPRKLEIQTSWMIAHPSMVPTCHGCEVSRMRADVWGPQPNSQVRTRDLRARNLISRNRVSARTIMVQRVRDERFVEGSRFCEDFDLWLRIVGSGDRCVLIEACLARSYKAPFGWSEQSSHFWATEMGDLRALDGAPHRHQLCTIWVRLAQAFSLLMFLRRTVIAGLWSMTRNVCCKGIGVLP